MLHKQISFKDTRKLEILKYNRQGTDFKFLSFLESRRKQTLVKTTHSIKWDFWILTPAH